MIRKERRPGLRGIDTKRLAHGDERERMLLPAPKPSDRFAARLPDVPAPSTASFQTRDGIHQHGQPQAKLATKPVPGFTYDAAAVCR
jgi:hypothetical protein